MAARYFVNGGVDNLWLTTGNWSLISGGAGGESVPSSLDDVFFDSNSPNCTITVSNRNCKSLDFTNYASTLAMSTFQLTVGGSVIFNSSGMNITGTNTTGLFINATATITSNGFIIPIVITFGTSTTFTLADNMFIGNSLRCSASIFNGFEIRLGDNSTFLVVTNGAICSGTSVISAQGINISLGASTTGIATGIGNPITINSAGTVTLRADSLGAFGLGLSTFTYLAGTVVFTATFVRLVSAGTVNFSLGSLILPALTVAVGAVIINPVQDINITNTLTLTTTSQIAAGNIYSGGLTMNGAMTASAGVLTLNGTGTWSGAFDFRNNLIINTAGILTISGSVHFETGTLTYTAGTVITTGSTLNIGASTTLNTNGMSWNNITLSAALTLTINSLLTATGSFTLPNANITFGGTLGWTVGTFTLGTNLTASRTVSFLSSVVYTITSAFTIITATNAFRALFVASTPGTKAVFTLNSGASQSIGYTNATDIDSNAGQNISSFNGVITTTFNWSTLTYPRPKTFVFEH